jgi:hypothetical protein
VQVVVGRKVVDVYVPVASSPRQVPSSGGHAAAIAEATPVAAHVPPSGSRFVGRRRAE